MGGIGSGNGIRKQIKMHSDIRTHDLTPLIRGSNKEFHAVYPYLSNELEKVVKVGGACTRGCSCYQTMDILNLQARHTKVKSFTMSRLESLLVSWLVSR